MSVVLYLHGFLSSPHSHKAKITKAWLEAHRPDVTFICPELPSLPALCEQLVLEHANKYPAHELNVIGSSLGGFWASYLAEKSLINKAVLVNPAVNPALRFRNLVGQHLKHYYSNEEICLSKKDIQHLEKCESLEIKFPEKYWVMLQTGDETLDYRLAEKKYKNCRLLIEKGGNHAFSGYEKWLLNIIEFFEE